MSGAAVDRSSVSPFAVICLPPSSGSTNSLVRRNPAEVCSLSCAVMSVPAHLNRYLVHYKQAFAFSAILCPLFRQLSLQTTYQTLTLCLEKIGVPTFRIVTHMSSVSPLHRWRNICDMRFPSTYPDHLPFGSSPMSHDMQCLWLVVHYGGSVGDSHPLTFSHTPSA